MSANEMPGTCAEVDEALSQILDGSAPARLLDHVAECDACRDLRHEATRAGELVSAAGLDFRPANDFVDQLVARLEGGALPTARTTTVEPPAVEKAAEAKITALEDHAPAPRSVAAPPDPRAQIDSSPRIAPAPVPRARPSFFRRPMVLAGLAGSMAAAAAGGFYLKGALHHVDPPWLSPPWSGTVASVSRAAADKTGGFEACDAGGACAPIASGAAIRAGTTLRTDARTRAQITLADGTELSLDRGSELVLSTADARAARLVRGTLVADVAHIEGSTAHFSFPHGDVEVLGTKLAITAGDERASIEVARGAVRVRDDTGRATDVRAGEEATLLRGHEPVVGSTSSLADTMEWSDRKPDETDAPVLRGLGELRARKPGQTNEKDNAVRLARHAVKVRIVDIVARTEVDETFANDTDEELEGIFRFPLPPGAQIEKLALEVDGKFVDGAFVDRDRGAAIWRGVIQNAAPRAPKPREEIIWVPGPWRDPALLEWQRGGRFELKIFPIPKRGSRRVVLAYTQPVEQAAGIRRFTYPLAHDPSGTTKVDAFDVDVQVLGLDKTIGLATRGYELASAPGDGERRTMHADAFVPAGDLTVEYALPDRDKDVTAWAYAAPPSDARAPSVTGGGAATTADEKAAAAAILDDHSPYVAIALRPKLPRWQEAKERVHAIVVDASRSMIGERFTRARLLASSVVREMDRRDTFVLLACDTVCRSMVGPSGGAPKPEAPGAAAAEGVERFLGGIEPDGGSDLAAAIGAARAAAGSVGSKELRIVYLGDGTPTVGPTRPAHLETAVKSALPGGDAAVIAVALGADADTTTLAAMARGGGGVLVPYVPGQKVSSAALDVLAAAYGVVLRDAEVELPAGLTQVTPARLDPIRAGGETLLVARMSGGNDVSGTIKLRGRVAGERFERAYPITVVAGSGAGNAFVPRLFAAAKIAELEQSGSDAQKATVVELSKRFAVASRFTSMLVLESEAMFNAFGVDRRSAASSFTGEVAAESSSTASERAEGDDTVDLGQMSAHASAMGSGPSAARRAPASLDSAFGGGLSAPSGDFATSAPGAGGFARSKSAATPAPLSPPEPMNDRRGDWDGSSGFPPRRMVPMRRVFDRKASFDAVNGFASQNTAKLAAAESTLASSPDSRAKTVELYALYATSGRIHEAQELTAKWSGRDALDPDALIARADLAARNGDRGRAVRILGGLADVRPNDRAIQTRLADLQDAAGNAALACEHRLALADMAMDDAKLVADAVRCARTQGMSDLARQLELDAADKIHDAVRKLLAAPAPAAPSLRGDIQIAADWSGGADLDVALVDAQGKRISWLGSASKAITSVRDATSPSTETLGVAGLPQGTYVVEITRGASEETAPPIHGDVTLRLAGEVRKLPFTLTGARVEVGTVRVFFTSRLVPVEGWRF